MNIAVLFDNFGPYHVARLKAASTQCNLLALEFAATSSDYAWQCRDAENSFRTTTIFRDGPAIQCSTTRLRRSLRKALGEFRPDAVAVPGWSGRLAFAATIW